MLAISLCLGLGSVSAGTVVPGPFGGAQGNGPALRESEPSRGAGGIMRALLGFQARLNRDIGRHLRAMREGDSPTAVIAGVAFAFLYGVLHTLGPGHGKFAVSSYFLAREARLWRGILMGAQIGLTHVISAVVLMLVADVSIRHLLGGPPAEFLWVRLLGCSATGVVGLLILWGAVRGARPLDDGHGHSHAGCHHGSDNRRQGLLALGVGLVPCTGALLVMLYAMANDMLVTGILMTAAIAAGMAATMSGLGILTILARQTVLRWVETGGQKPGRARRVLEIGGATVLLAFSALMLIGSL